MVEVDMINEGSSNSRAAWSWSRGGERRGQYQVEMMIRTC